MNFLQFGVVTWRIHGFKAKRLLYSIYDRIWFHIMKDFIIIIIIIIIIICKNIMRGFFFFLRVLINDVCSWW